MSAARRAALRWTLPVLLLAAHLCLNAIAQKLGTVHTIFIAPVEDGSSSAAIARRLASQLERSGGVRIISDSAAADAVLHATASIWASGTVSPSLRSNATREINYQGNLSAELISRDQQTLWSYMVTPRSSRSSSIADDLADQLAAHLIAAVRSGIPFPASSGATAIGSSVTIRGAGSTLPAPLYLKWFESYAQARPGVTILYDPVGSEAGIDRLRAGSIDFAGSDIPVSTLSGSTASSVLALPTVLAAVVPIYNLPSLEGRTLNLTPAALAGIYSGTIRKWNDPVIRESNRGTRLPDADIAVFHRSDGSGTTFIWTSFLSEVDPGWKSHYGAHPSISWPAGAAAQGSEGMVQAVSRTPHSIGYVELIYALQHRINYAAVQNPAGHFVKANIQSVSDAVSATAATDEGDNVSILNAQARDAYPISSYTWIFVPEQSSDEAKRAAMVAFLRWMLTSGQKECEGLGYVPLPRRVAAHHLDLLSRLK